MMQKDLPGYNIELVKKRINKMVEIRKIQKEKLLGKKLKKRKRLLASAYFKEQKRIG